VKTIQVEWPSGTKQNFAGLPANQIITIDESKGIMPASNRRTSPPVGSPQPAQRLP
jgi:hypothetical protein